MPKLSKVEACLLCEQVPCECGGKKVSPRPKAQTADKQAPAMQSVDRAGGKSMRDKMKAAAAQVPPVAPISAEASRNRSSKDDKKIAPPQPPSSPNPDTILAVAIRNLTPLLHDDELKRYSVIINSRTTPADRAAFWRAGQDD